MHVRRPARAGGGERVALLGAPGPDWVRAFLDLLAAGAAVVPLAPGLPRPEVEHALDEARVSRIVATPDLAGPVAAPAAERGLPLVAPANRAGAGELRFPDLPEDAAAVLLFTSGTTGRPKAVLHTAGSLRAQVRILAEAWEWSAADRILSVLPLHHTHGLVNVVLSAVCAGAGLEFLTPFDPRAVWDRLAVGDVTLFMAVPTIYSRLLASFRRAPRREREAWARGAARLRLFVSGSAALPESLFTEFLAATGQAILERYGMTEFGMALGNPLRGDRLPGTVGGPLPEVEVRLAPGSGELLVRSPGMFREYLGRPEETRAAFAGGWFRTGDEAEIRDGSYRILGRQSVDILKSGGEKVSALEVEAVLLGHPKVAECAVVGVPDPEWGERVVAFVVPARGGAPEREELRSFARGRLAAFKVPREVRIVAALPRNALGKVRKRSLAGE